uniref:Uncharacterized protein n=1 Tax=Anopheles melas TaxID=34690 RepID=A0A182U6F7_9DIPT
MQSVGQSGTGHLLAQEGRVQWIVAPVGKPNTAAGACRSPPCRCVPVHRGQRRPGIGPRRHRCHVVQCNDVVYAGNGTGHQ